ncbi:hypothetical protein RHMOL_Rhmol01G0020400 [Rhododendron molle]|uniref:Uncharacterized protein n=1 Tax=Rhododendron molle TaxID=49168 RepID=A0ACC0PYM1_RHOML|nr:hypothetical protein RHMOL_Rhmol01G0020400 [Rhododendron molle]
MRGKDLLIKGLKWRIGTGNRIRVLKDQRIPKVCKPLLGVTSKKKRQAENGEVLGGLKGRQLRDSQNTFNSLDEEVDLTGAWHFVMDEAWGAESMRGAAA